MVENGTTTSEATTTILGATITLIAISVYQLKIMLYLPFQQLIQLQIKVRGRLKRTYNLTSAFNPSTNMNNNAPSSGA